MITTGITGTTHTHTLEDHTQHFHNIQQQNNNHEVHRTSRD